MAESRCDHCDHCKQADFVADRLLVWKTANATLRNEKWPDDQMPTQEDVFHLAEFLAGEG